MTVSFDIRRLARLRPSAGWSQVLGVAGLAGLCLTSSCATSRALTRRQSRQGHPIAAQTTPRSIGKNAAQPSYADRLAQAEDAMDRPGRSFDPAVEHAVVDGQELVATVEPLGYEGPDPSHAAAFGEDQGGSARVRPAAGSVEAARRPWAPDLDDQPGVPPFNTAALTSAVYHPAPARLPLASTVCPPAAVPGGGAACPQEDGSDEYVCDGGDRGLPVHYESGAIAGLEPEDTVAEFTDDVGERHVQASNRVCVYAPRFGVARSVSDAVADFTVEKAAGAHNGLQSDHVADHLVIIEDAQASPPLGADAQARVSGLATAQTGGDINKDVAAAVHAKLVNAFLDYGFLQTGRFDAGHRDELLNWVEAAGEWETGQAPQVVAKDLAGQSVLATFRAEEMDGTEDRRTGGELRIVKLADRKTAQVGDVVTFAIRFDNLGGRELRDVRILDSLSPRLELIDDSVRCERPGAGVLPCDLQIVEDGVTSRLEFRLDDPLAGQTGGVIKFQCRVR